MFRSTLPAACAWAVLLVGCAPDRLESPSAPAAERPLPVTEVTAETRALEGLTRRFALALADPAFRRYLKDRFDASPYPEHKLQFQRWLSEDGKRPLEALARATGDGEERVAQEAARAIPLEAYLPVPAHRRSWNGDAPILVATAVQDGEIPVAYDPTGGRHYLDPTHPPATPVIALVPVETSFDRPGAPAGQMCLPDTPGCGGGGGGSPTPPPGLYMTYAHFTQTFEGWLKGSPEFEIHVLGQKGTSDSLMSYQCAGEHATSPYWFDQNKLDWTGSVLLFNDYQITTYKQQHPGEALRLFAVEDDDTSCQIKNDPTRVKNFLDALDRAFFSRTAGTEVSNGLQDYWDDALTFISLFVTGASLIKTNDELIGNAVQDSVVGQFIPGANWIVKDDQMHTNGWLKLEMR